MENLGTPDKVHVETYTENSSRTEIECIDIKVEYKDYFRQLENVEEDLVLDLDLDSTVNYEDYVVIASYQSSPLTAQTTILNTLLSVGFWNCCYGYLFNDSIPLYLFNYVNFGYD